MKEKILSGEAENTEGGELVSVREGRFSSGVDKLKTVFGRIGVKNLVVIGSVALIGAAVTLNFVMFGNSEKTVSSSEPLSVGIGTEDAQADVAEEDTYFASAQLSRKQARDQALAVLKSVVDSTAAAQTAKEQASVDISRITSEMEAEANIETLIRSKGFEDCIAVIGEGSASIIVRSDGLLPNELSQIKEIVWEQAGIDPVGIKIIEQSST